MIVKKDRNAKGQLKWVFEPWPRAGEATSPEKGSCMHTSRPQPDDMTWDDDEGRVHVGEAVYVGMLGSNAGDVALDASTELFKQGLFNQQNMFSMPVTTELFLRV